MSETKTSKFPFRARIKKLLSRSSLSADNKSVLTKVSTTLKKHLTTIVRIGVLLLAAGIGIFLAKYIAPFLTGLLPDTPQSRLPANITIILLGLPIAAAIWFFRTTDTLAQQHLSQEQLNFNNFSKFADWFTDPINFAESTDSISSQDTQAMVRRVLGLQQLIALKHKGIFETEINLLTRKNADLRQANLEGAKLQGAHLQKADLQGASLKGANLYRAKLKKANLFLAKLQDANLQGAKLQRAKLQGAFLQGAALQHANLQGAKLQGAKLQGAKLKEVDLEGAYLEGAKLHGATYGGVTLTAANAAEYLKGAIYLDKIDWSDSFPII